MALPTIVKIYNRSDFTVQLPLADGYDGQEFRFTLYTCGEIENGWVASYIDGVYSNCTVNEDVVTVYVNNNNNMNPGCLTVQTEYDYFNGHFADNEDNVKDNYKTNIYLVDYQTNAFSASFRPSNLPDLTGSNDYVTFSDLEAMSYITADDVSQMGYVTNEQLLADLSGYATKTYVADYVATYSGNIDMSAYVTKDELNAAGYATKAQLTLKQDRLVSGTNIKTINNNSLLGSGNLEVVTDLTGYATESYVANYVDTHAPQPDLSAYVTKSELNAAGYISSIPSEYITESELTSELSSYAKLSDLSTYATQSYVANYVATYGGNVDLSAYATKAYVAEYVATYGGNVDMSAYVTKTELNNAGYISSIPSEYVTESELNSALSSYITQDELSANGYLTQHQDLSAYAKLTDLNAYATKTYVSEYVATYGGNVDMSAYVTKTELNNAGYISSIPSEYITETELSSSLSSYATKSYVANYVATYGGNVDMSAYVTKTELNNASYATQSYVVNYVATYGGNVDLSAYVTKTELNNAGYLTYIPSEYVTQSELSANSYVTESFVTYYVNNNTAVVREITQQDYDLLSYEEKNNGYLYIITDSQGININSFVTYAALDSMGYATQTYVAQYVSSYAPEPDLSAYATKTYVAEYVAAYAPEPDLSAYVTKTELNNAGYLTSIPSDYATYAAISQMGYLTSIPSEYITQDELSQMGYLTQHQDLSAYAKLTDLNSYVTKTELNNAGYITMSDVSACGYLTSIPSDYATYAAISQMGYLTSIPSEYITQDELSANAYLTQHQDLSAYATKSYVAEYVAAYAPEPDLSSYVTKTELNNAGYITSIPSDYATYAAISQMGYLTSIPSEYITQDELSQMGYLTQHQDLSSYAKLADLNSYVTKTELNNAGYISSIPSDYATYDAIYAMGYITAIPSDYATYDAISAMGYITAIPSDYATYAAISSMSYITMSDVSACGYLTEHQDLSAYATKSYVVEYVAAYAPQPDLSSYATQTYVVDYVGAYGGAQVVEITQEQYDQLSQAEKTNGSIYVITDAPDLDMSYYVTYEAVSYMGYATQSYVADYVAAYAPQPDLSSYVTKTELNNAGYLTSIPSDYATYAAISSMSYITMSDVSACGYLTSIPSEYITDSELSGMGYITSIPSDYATYDAISQMGYITSSDLPVIDESIIPNTDNTYTLGNSSYIYSDLYANSHWFNSNSRIRNLTGGIQIIKNGIAIAQFKTTPEFSPNSNKLASLGASDNMWSATYTESLYINGYTGLSSYNFQYDSATNTLTITV